jgi:hypothetical protein
MNIPHGARTALSALPHDLARHGLQLRLTVGESRRKEKRQRADRAPRRCRVLQARRDSARFWSAASPLPLWIESVSVADSVNCTPAILKLCSL